MLERVLGGEIREPQSWILAIAALSFAFGKTSVFSLDFFTSPYFIGILLGFVVHELAHRGVARMYGLSADFVAYVPGLIITFLSGFLPIVLIAPGYVRVFGWGESRGVFYSVIAGPLTNIAIAAVAILLSPWSSYLLPIAFINSWLAFFNLLPIPPLDGSKIIRGSPSIWVAMLLASAVLLFLAA
ncbi:MAG: site-2 protease family protein [Acidilobaceae archaeon]|nr:site-2 protease family protein [Acidilobaceae archaeon]MCX8165703.1 site-2 protease family protein [Acidilobaceae archaeon]MDW7974128.1 site-2 protease family protein [Sulfolobales archaeon]